MTINSKKASFHLFLIVGITVLLIVVMVYPFLPGEYDRLAVSLSTMIQAFGVIALLLVPIGILWLIYELRKQLRIKRKLTTKARRYYFAVFTLIISSLIAVILSFLAFVTAGLSVGLITFVLWVVYVLSLSPTLRLMRSMESEHFNPVVFYLICLPLATLIFQLLLAAPMTDFSRDRAIIRSAELIDDIETYHTSNGYYPRSLLATWKDYSPAVVGIEKFHYEPQGEAYNLIFEQPRFLLDNIGTREFVVYNPLDEQTVISHVSWILLLRPERLQRSQGWFAVHDASSPHWKYFWFD